MYVYHIYVKNNSYKNLLFTFFFYNTLTAKLGGNTLAKESIATLLLFSS